MQNALAGKRILVTQASEFMGPVLCEVFAEQGATVVASTHVEAYRLDKAGFQSIIEQRPELADTLSRILERRLQTFAELERGYMEGQGKVPQPTPGSAAIGRKIREFFGLD